MCRESNTPFSQFIFPKQAQLRLKVQKAYTGTKIRSWFVYYVSAQLVCPIGTARPVTGIITDFLREQFCSQMYFVDVILSKPAD